MKYTAEAREMRASIPAKFEALDAFMASIAVADPAALSAAYAVTPSATAPVPCNPAVATALERTQAELFGAVSALSTIQAWLQLSIPAVEDGNNFGVGIVMEGIKTVSEIKKALQDELKTIPDYFKERASAAEKLSPKISTSSSEGTSSGSDAETKAGEEEKATAKKGASSSTKKEVSSSTVVPDAVAHAVAIDVNWHLRLFGICDKVKMAYAVVEDFLEKNQARIAEPKGSGGGMSMF